MSETPTPGAATPGAATPDALPADWPHRWAADVVLSDGGTAHLRPIEPADADRLRDFHALLTPETIYYRFFAPYPRLSDKDLARFTQVDQVRRGALVAVLGDEIVGVARWEGGPGEGVPAEAEVAFVVRDDQQGRGLGSVLLEHLAAAGRERGVERFTADVLPDNRQMVKVFLDAGYTTERAYTDGVVRLTFAIEPTTQSLDVSQAREHSSESASVARLLSPRSVAVVGASRDVGSEGFALLRNLLVGGFAGPVYPVHPSDEWVASVPAHARLADVPGSVDLAVVAVPAAAVRQVVAEAADAGVHGLVVVSSGFGETGPEGAAAEAELVRLARSEGMRVVGPNCLGIINTDPAVRLNASLVPQMPSRGAIGFFSQSGALGIQILSSVQRRGLGLSTFVSAGNRADVSGNDALQYWEDDPATDVVLLYLESFGNPRKFARLARRVSRRKPVVVVKSGRDVPRSHSRGVAVTGTTQDALFAQAGVIRVDSVEQLFDTAQLLALQPLPMGDRVAVIGNSSALARLASDEAENQGLVLAEPGAAVRAEVVALLGEGASVNPIDLGPHARADDLARLLAALQADPGVDAVVAAYVPALRTRGEEVAAVLLAAGGHERVPLATAFLGELGVPEGLRVTEDGVLCRGSVPSYVSPEAAVRALARARRYASWRARPTGDLRLFDDLDVEAAAAFCARRLAGAPRAELSEAQVRELLGLLGITVWEQAGATSEDEAVEQAARLGWPVALKSTDSHRRHRADLGGVRLDLGTADALRTAWPVVAGPVGAVVQAMAPVGVATVVELVEDPSFGPVVSFAVGGVASELLHDRAYRTVPLTDIDAAGMIGDVRAAPMLTGWRGSDPVALEPLAELLQRVAAVGEHLPQVVRLELNPVVAHPGGLTVLGAAVELAPSVNTRSPGPRRLR